MTAPGVLLLPGWAMPPEALAALVPPGASGVASPRWEVARGPDDLVPLALEAAARAPGEQLVVIGWSLGAMVALEALPALPGRLAALHLVAPCLRFTDGWPRRVLERMRRRCADDAVGVRGAFERALLAPGEQAAIPPAGPAWPPAALQAGLGYLAGRALSRPVRRPGCVARIVHGEADAVIPADLSRPVADALGAARRTLPGAGHAPVLTRAAECAAFLAGDAGAR